LRVHRLWQMGATTFVEPTDNAGLYVTVVTW
jgi:hypothetical protein